MFAFRYFQRFFLTLITNTKALKLCAYYDWSAWKLNRNLLVIKMVAIKKIAHTKPHRLQRKRKEWTTFVKRKYANQRQIIKIPFRRISVLLIYFVHIVILVVSKFCKPRRTIPENSLKDKLHAFTPNGF